MPEISFFYGIHIYMHFGGEHPPAHVHVYYAEFEAKVGISDGAIIVGSLPSRAQRLVREWIGEHPDELEAAWERVMRHEAPGKIEPLR